MPGVTERMRKVALDGVGLSCDMVQPALASSNLEMAKFSLTSLIFGEFKVVALTKPNAGVVWG